MFSTFQFEKKKKKKKKQQQQQQQQQYEYKVLMESEMEKCMKLGTAYELSSICGSCSLDGELACISGP